MSKAAVRIIKKYPNRRLYDTKTSSYITQSDLKELIINATDDLEFKVFESRTNSDITYMTLLQIICDEEENSPKLFSEKKLIAMIKSYQVGQAVGME